MELSWYWTRVSSYPSFSPSRKTPCPGYQAIHFTSPPRQNIFQKYPPPDTLSKVTLCIFSSILDCNLANRNNPALKVQNYRPRGAFSGLRHCNGIWRILVQTQVSPRSDWGTQPRYEAPGDLQIKNVKKQWSTSGKRSCSFDDGSRWWPEVGWTAAIE